MNAASTSAPSASGIQETTRNTPRCLSQRSVVFRHRSRAIASSFVTVRWFCAAARATTVADQPGDASAHAASVCAVATCTTASSCSPERRPSSATLMISGLSRNARAVFTNARARDWLSRAVHVTHPIVSSAPSSRPTSRSSKTDKTNKRCAPVALCRVSSSRNVASSSGVGISRSWASNVAASTAEGACPSWAWVRSSMIERMFAS